VLAIALAIPLPAVISTGMEATLHVLLALLLSASVLIPGPGTQERPWRIGALAALCVLTRFESLFLVGPLALAAWAGGRRRVAVAVVAGTLAALGGYSAFSLPQGGLWLPNSVLAKAPVAELNSYEGFREAVSRIPYQLFVRRFSHMTALLVAAGWLLLPRPRKAGNRARAARAMLAVFAGAAILHIEFAGLGWFYRYEAYLVALGLLAIAAALGAGTALLPGRLGARPAPFAVRAIAALVALVLATPIANRTQRSARQIAPAMRNIYEQQFQMARLVSGHFAGRAVALNDLGAIGYYGNARVVDLMGLADCDIARARIENRFDRDAIERACAARGVEVALVYRGWFEAASTLPSTWLPLARWTVPEGVTVGDTTVTIFATRAESAARVRAALDAFDPELPPQVRVTRLD